MATQYSTNFAALATPTTFDPFKVNGVEVHGRVRYKRMQLETLGVVTAASVARMGTFKSTDRIISLHFSSDDLGTTGTIDIGLYLSGTAHDGAVVDGTLFASAIDVNTAAVARTDAFAESTTSGIEWRGQELWKIADNGAGTYSVDPQVNFDICLVFATATTAAGSILLEAFYLAND